MKKVISFFIVIVSILFIGLSFVNYYTYIDKSDSINDADEKLIKKFRSNHDYTFDELKELQIEYLDDISGFRIYLVEYGGDITMGSLTGWEIDEYVFPIGASTKIIGVKDNKLYVSGKFIYETSIDIPMLYDLVYSLYEKEG